MQGLPAARQAFKPVEGVFLSNRGLILPSVPLSASNWWTILALVAGLTVFTIVRRRLIAQQMLDGNARPAWPYALGLIVALPALVSFLAGASWRIVLPELRGFNFVGGLTLAPEYFALLIALVTYTSAFIAEIVRSGIQAVPRGQSEAAKALGLKRGFVLQHIVLPQALRYVIPGIVNSFISLFKDTSLVSIVALFDLLGSLRASFSDPNWSTPTTAFTGFAFAGMIYFVFCFGMSRYSLFVENRLNAHRRH